MKSTERGGRRPAIRVGAAALGAVAALTIAACGDSDDEGSAPAEGGEVTIAQTSQPDFLDPALTYTANGIEPLWLVYTPLLGYRRAEGLAGAELIPGLAEDLPEISADGKTYTLTLRDGLRYSDGSAVKAS
ncbi:MAG TPA: ABC transporter substrate-binding protein, partial [Solirubrobacterales bacterium]|nr:ABC transporter substrate-binding protein [Solirubrobacterales bacterium]